MHKRSCVNNKHSSSNIHSLSDILSQVMLSLEEKRVNSVEVKIEKQWGSLVGEKIAKHTKVGYVENNILIILIEFLFQRYVLRQ